MTENTFEEQKTRIQKKIRREVFWQITLPLLVGVILILGVGAWTIFKAAGGHSIRQAADTSLIFLLCPNLAMAVLPRALFGGLAYGVIWMNKNFPVYLHKAQEAFIKVRQGVRQGADKLVEPVLKLKSSMAALDVLKRKS
jgi:hypothetical protein